MTRRLTGIVVAACLAAVGCGGKAPAPPPSIPEPTAVATSSLTPRTTAPEATGAGVMLPSQSTGDAGSAQPEATGQTGAPVAAAAPPAKWPIARQIEVGFPVSGAAFAPDGATLTVVGPKGLKLFSTADGSALPLPPGAEKLTELSCVGYSADGAKLAVGQAKLSAPGRIFVWDLPAAAEPVVLEGHQKLVASLAWGAQGHDLLLSGGSDWLVLQWDLAKKAVKQTFRGHSEYVTSVAVNPNGQTAVSAGGDRIVAQWDLVRPQVPRQQRGHFMSINSVVYSPDGKTIVSGGSDGAVIFWDVARGAQVGTFFGHVGGATSAVTSIAYRPAGNALATGCADKIVRVLDVTDFAKIKLVAQLEGHTDYVNVVAFSRDGRWLVSGGEDGQAIIWQAPEVVAAK